MLVVVLVLVLGLVLVPVLDEGQVDEQGPVLALALDEGPDGEPMVLVYGETTWCFKYRIVFGCVWKLMLCKGIN